MVGAEFPNEAVMQRAVYDFSLDAGAVGQLELFEATQDCVILAAYLNVKTACTSGGLATVSFGIDASLTALSAATAVASLSAAALIKANDSCPVKLPSGSKVKMDIAVAALTAGKVEFVLLLAKL